MKDWEVLGLAFSRAVGELKAVDLKDQTAVSQVVKEFQVSVNPIYAFYLLAMLIKREFQSDIASVHARGDFQFSGTVNVQKSLRQLSPFVIRYFISKLILLKGQQITITAAIYHHPPITE